MAANNKRKYGLFCFYLLVSLLLTGLCSYIWQLQQQFKIEIINLKQALNTQALELKPKLEQFSSQIQSIQQNLQHVFKPSADIENIKWLIQQAQWEINLYSQKESSQQLLTQAYQMALQQHWQELADAIQNDLHQVQTTPLTANIVLLQNILHLQQAIEGLTPIHPGQALIGDTNTTKWLQVFRPYIDIRPYVNKVTPPNDWVMHHHHLLLLLPQIQYAALTQQNELFHQLVNELKSNWQPLSAWGGTDISAMISSLQSFQFQLSSPLVFQSSRIVAELESRAQL